MTALAIRSAGADQRGQPAARRGDARDVRADVAGPAPRPTGPVTAVTNGVHVPTWIAARAGRLCSRSYLGADWLDRHDDPALWDGVLAIPDEELWAVRQSLRRYLFTFVRERARQRWIDRARRHPARRRRRHAARSGRR